MEIPDPAWKIFGDDFARGLTENEEYEDENPYVPKKPKFPSKPMVIDLDKIREEVETIKRLRKGETI